MFQHVKDFEFCLKQSQDFFENIFLACSPFLFEPNLLIIFPKTLNQRDIEIHFGKRYGRDNNYSNS